MPSEKRQRQNEGRLARLEQQQLAKRRSQRFRQVRSLLILLGLLVVVAVLISVLSGDDDSSVSTEESTTTTAGGDSEAFAYGTTACPADDAERTTSFEDAFEQCIDADKTYTATFDTSAGAVVVALDTERTPGTTNNFVSLARSSYYDGTELFRTDPSIGIIQGGAPSNSASDPGPGYTIPDEGGSFTYRPGQLVMARTANPDSAGAQFFFAADAAVSALDDQGTYVVFGEVTEGLDVLEQILASHVPGGQLGGSPEPAVTITSVTITET